MSDRLIAIGSRGTHREHHKSRSIHEPLRFEQIRFDGYESTVKGTLVPQVGEVTIRLDFSYSDSSVLNYALKARRPPPIGSPHQNGSFPNGNRPRRNLHANENHTPSSVALHPISSPLSYPMSVCSRRCRPVPVAAIFVLVLSIVAPARFADAAVFAGVDDGMRERFNGAGAPSIGATFALNPNFPISESQISGIAIDSNGGSHQSAVLITPKHYVAANHNATTAPWFRGSDGVIREYQTVGSTLLTTDFEFDGMMMTGNSDIRIWTIDDSMPLPGDHGVTPIPILQGPQGGFINRELFASDQFNRFGRNVIDDIDLATFSNNGAGVPNQPTFGIVFDFDTLASGNGVGPDEIHLASGDSGNAAIAVVDGNVALIGNHFGVDNTANPQLSVSTWLSPYVGQINNYTSAQSGGYTVSTITVIPEPGSAFALLIAATTLVCRRRSADRRQSTNR